MGLPALLGSAVAVLAGSVSASGCVVSESKFKSKIEELEACRSDRDDVIAERNALRDKVPTLESKLKEEMDASREELTALREQRAELGKQLAEYEKLTERFKGMVGSEGINVDVRRGRMMVSLPSGVLFPSGSANISEGGEKTLKKVATKLKDFKDRRFIIAGHTDNVPIRKAGKSSKSDKSGKSGKSGPEIFADNWELSAARALRVTRFLIAQGIKPKNLAAAGYGQNDPVRSNKRASGRRQNRRIEIILEPRLPDFRKLAVLSKRAKTIEDENKKSQDK